MATPTNHIYTSQLKDLLGVDTGYSGDDFRINLAISSATQTIENLLGRTLSYQTNTEVYGTKTNFIASYDLWGVNHSGYKIQPNSNFIQLRNYPVDTTADITVVYDTAGRFLDDSLTLDPTQYDIDPNTGILTLLIDTVACNRAIKITYSSGYQPVVNPDDEDDISIAPNLPADLVMACVYQALHVYSKQSGSNINVTGQLSTAKSSKSNYVNMAAVAPEAMAIIVQNRKPRFAVI